MATEPLFFTTMDNMLARFDATGRRMALTASGPAGLHAWQHELRAQFRRLIGLDTMTTAPLEPHVTETVQCAGYIRQRVEVHTAPDVMMPLYVLVPDGLRPGELRAAVITPHGHGAGGKLATAGCDRNPAVAQAILQFNGDYGVQFVRQGLVVFCPDARGFGERREVGRQDDGNLLNSSCDLINHMALPLGQIVTGMFAWDLMRLIDYIEGRPDCDPKRVGCAGLSGGGMQTLWLTALDERIRCAVVSGYFYGYKDALLRLNGNCSCNYVPGLWQLADMGDIGALIAPRPLLIETGDADPLNGEHGVANVLEQVAITRHAYALLNAEERLCHHIFAGEHRWCGEKSVPWLVSHLAAA